MALDLPESVWYRDPPKFEADDDADSVNDEEGVNDDDDRGDIDGGLW